MPHIPLKRELEPMITLGREAAGDGATFVATMTVSGLRSEAQAQAATDHMEKLFCGAQQLPMDAALSDTEQAEAVAWQYRDANDDGTWGAWLGCDKRLASSPWREVRALYLHPPATPPSPSEEPAMPCGHHPSLMLHSAETGESLYCELCDDKSGRKDAELRETELAEANRVLREKLAAQPSGEVLTEEDIRDALEQVNFTYNPTKFARAIESATLAKIGARHG